MDMRSQNLEPLNRRCVAIDKHRINVFQCRQNLRALKSRYERPPGAPITPHRGVRIYTDNQNIALSFRKSEITDMPYMQDVEVPVGRDNSLSLCLGLCNEPPDSRKREHFRKCGFQSSVFCGRMLQHTLTGMTHKDGILLRAFQRHSDVVAESMRHILPSVERGAGLLQDTIRRSKTVFTCGNGGSAADSQHCAAELVVRYKKNRKAVRAIALATDTSVITAIGNDYGFEDIFKRQIEALGHKGDLLIAFTTSGASQNIRRALAAARERGMKVILMTGQKGVQLARRADVGIIVPSAETARIQEVHQLIYHAWCEYIDHTLFS